MRPLGTRVSYTAGYLVRLAANARVQRQQESFAAAEMVVDGKTGRPRAESVRPEVPSVAAACAGSVTLVSGRGDGGRTRGPRSFRDHPADRGEVLTSAVLSGTFRIWTRSRGGQGTASFCKMMGRLRRPLSSAFCTLSCRLVLRSDSIPTCMFLLPVHRYFSPEPRAPARKCSSCPFPVTSLAGPATQRLRHGCIPVFGVRFSLELTPANSKLDT